MIRGGISMIFKVYAETNNKFVKSYDPNKLTSYIMHLDTNNFYGLSVMQLLSCEIFNGLIQKKKN